MYLFEARARVLWRGQTRHWFNWANQTTLARMTINQRDVPVGSWGPSEPRPISHCDMIGRHVSGVGIINGNASIPMRIKHGIMGNGEAKLATCHGKDATSSFPSGVYKGNPPTGLCTWPLLFFSIYLENSVSIAAAVAQAPSFSLVLSCTAHASTHASQAREDPGAEGDHHGQGQCRQECRRQHGEVKC